MKLIIDDMELNDIRNISRHISKFLEGLGYGIDDFKEIRNIENKVTGVDYNLYKIDKKMI